MYHFFGANRFPELQQFSLSENLGVVFMNYVCLYASITQFNIKYTYFNSALKCNITMLNYQINTFHIRASK